MEIALPVVRAANYAATALVFGELAFAHLVAPRMGPSGRSMPVMAWGIAAAVVSAIAWLCIEAGHMSGLPWHEALGRDTLATVAGHTTFGEFCSLRIALWIGVAVTLPWLRAGRRQGAERAAFALALLATACLAATGHATTSDTRLVVDAFHVVAAAAWVGALLPFARMLRQSVRVPDAASYEASREATRRFSTLGIASVATLVVTGFINASYSLPSFAALYESSYGRLLMAKLALFAAMLALAAVNRVRHTASLSTGGPEAIPAAMRALRRNAIIEFALGVLVVAIVAQLGITMPPEPMTTMHVH